MTDRLEPRPSHPAEPPSVEASPRTTRTRRRLKPGLLPIFLLALCILLLLIPSLYYGIRLYKEAHPPLFDQRGPAIWFEKGKTGAYRPTAAGNYTEVWAPAHEPLIPRPTDTTVNMKAMAKRLKAWRKDPQGPLPLQGLIVYLDPGHGGKDPGAMWSPEIQPTPSEDRETEEGESPATTQPPLQEKDLTLDLALTLAQDLRALGADVRLLRSDDRFLSIYARAALVGRDLLSTYLQETASQVSHADPSARQLRHELESLLPQLVTIVDENRDAFAGMLGIYGSPDQARLLYEVEALFPEVLYLSLHVNASLRPEAHGSQVYLLRNFSLYDSFNWDAKAEGYSPKRHFELADQNQVYPLYLFFDDAARESLATALYRGLTEALPELQNAEIKRVPDYNFAVLRSINLPAVLVETAFITHDEDRALLQNPSVRKRMAQGLCEGVQSYILTHP